MGIQRIYRKTKVWHGNFFDCGKGRKQTRITLSFAICIGVFLGIGEQAECDPSWNVDDFDKFSLIHSVSGAYHSSCGLDAALHSTCCAPPSVESDLRLGSKMHSSGGLLWGGCVLLTVTARLTTFPWMIDLSVGELSVPWEFESQWFPQKMTDVTPWLERWCCGRSL